MGVDFLLLIDDSDIDNLINQRIVERARFARQVVVKKSARQGLEYLKNTFETNLAALPQVILLDIRMPDLDGFGFLEEFNLLDPAIHDRCKIAMLSSSIDAEDIRRACENQFVKKFVTKPLTASSLAEIEMLL